MSTITWLLASGLGILLAIALFVISDIANKEKNKTLHLLVWGIIVLIVIIGIASSND